MKLPYSILLSLATSMNISAQPWCPALGAQWWHTYAQVGGLYGTVVTNYVSDSLVDGESWQKLRVVATYQDLSVNGPILSETWNELTKRTDQTVMLRQGVESDTLYRFDAEIGDRWSVPFTTTPELTYVVTGVGDTVVDGVALGWSAVDVVTEEGGLYFSDTLIERLGFMEQFIWPGVSLSLEPNILGLRCYSDDLLDYQRYPDQPCDVGLLVTAFGASPLDVSVWYDGSASTLNIRSTHAQPKNYQMLDVSGRMLDQGTIRSGVTRMAVEDLPTGVYMLRLLDETGSSSQHKWMKD